MKSPEFSMAIGEIKSIHQTIGKLEIAMKRCKPGTKLFEKYDKALTELNNKSSEISSRLTMEYHLAMTKKSEAAR